MTLPPKTGCTLTADGHALIRHHKPAFRDIPMAEPVTYKQLTAFDLSTSGLTMKETAGLMKVQPSTVKTSVRELRQRLCVQTNTEALAKLIRMGVIEP